MHSLGDGWICTWFLMQIIKHSNLKGAYTMIGD